MREIARSNSQSYDMIRTPGAKQQGFCFIGEKLTMSALKQQIQEDMKTALKSGEKQRLAAIRLIIAGIKQREIDERIELTDTDVIALLDKMGKQRRESISQYQAAGRQELVDQEQFELDLIQSYLPQPLSEDEITKLIAEAVSSTGANSMKDMGKVMGILKPKLQGRADMSAVSARIKEQLA